MKKNQTKNKIKTHRKIKKIFYKILPYNKPHQTKTTNTNNNKIYIRKIMKLVQQIPIKIIHMINIIII